MVTFLTGRASLCTRAGGTEVKSGVPSGQLKTMYVSTWYERLSDAGEAVCPRHALNPRGGCTSPVNWDRRVLPPSGSVFEY